MRVTPHSVGRCLRKQTEGTAAVSGWVTDPEGEKTGFAEQYIKQIANPIN